MFALVADVDAYPQFLPWCGGARVLSRDGDRATAAVDIDFHGIRQGFTTINTEVPFERIDMALVDGPFSRLEGGWRFSALGDDACRVALVLDYDFSSFLLGKLVGPVFHQIASSMVDSFVRRADAVAASTPQRLSDSATSSGAAGGRGGRGGRGG